MEIVEQSYVQMPDSIASYKQEPSCSSWSNEEHITSWINQLNECSFSSQTESFSSTRSLDVDAFLQLPMLNKEDDLILGAEAKHFCQSSFTLSPRLSPLVLLEEKDSNIENLAIGVSNSENKATLDANTDELLCDKQQSVANIVQQSLSFERQSTFDSVAGSVSAGSLLASVLATDPEEILYNLGFCDTNPSTSIPARFFQQPSVACGIDVEEYQQTLLLESDRFSYEDSLSANPLTHSRFSSSSIDLMSNSSGGEMSAKARRILFKSTNASIPSIHLWQESDRSMTPSSASSTWRRLTTLTEEPEPRSNNSSFEQLVTRGDTLTEDDKHRLTLDRRSISERSMASEVTVVEKEGCAFKPIKNEDIVCTNSEPITGVKRSAFARVRSRNVDVENESIPGDFNEPIVVSTPLSKPRLQEQTTKRTLNDSVRDFFRRIKHTNEGKEVNTSEKQKLPSISRREDDGEAVNKNYFSSAIENLSKVIADRKRSFGSKDNIAVLTPDTGSPLHNAYHDSPRATGYAADSSSCEESVPRKKREKLRKGGSMESSGFDEEQSEVKCPFGKNCSINHEKTAHKLKQQPPCCEVCQSECSDVSAPLINHAHFDFLLQQVKLMRAESREQSRQQNKREMRMKEYLAEHLYEMKVKTETMTFHRLITTIDCLKTELQNKDEEIQRLKSIVNNTT